MNYKRFNIINKKSGFSLYGFVFWRKQGSFEYSKIKINGLMNLPNYSLISGISYGMIDNFLEHIVNIQSQLGFCLQNLQSISRPYAYGFIAVKGQVAGNKFHTFDSEIEGGAQKALTNMKVQL